MSSAILKLRMKARERGFTLIELMVSLTILGVILGLLGAGLRVIAKNWDVNSERIETLDMVSRAADILNRDASGLLRIVATLGNSSRFLFTGTPDRLAFVTLEPPYPSAAGPYFISYSVALNGSDAELVRARAPYLRGMQAFPGATPANRVRLLQGPFRYKFSYAQKTSGGGKWLDVWPTATRIPDLIRLQVFDVRKQAQVAPPTIVAVAADAELSCLAKKPKVCSAKTGGELKAANKTLSGDAADKYKTGKQKQ